LEIPSRKKHIADSDAENNNIQEVMLPKKGNRKNQDRKNNGRKNEQVKFCGENA